MIKLIQFEFKKIFKNKFNVLLLILTLGACFYMIQDQTSGYYYHEEYVSLENETLNDIETMLYVDEFKHLHAGNVDKEYLEEMKDLYNSYTEKLQMDEIDDELMKTYYGNNYLEIMEAGEKGGMSVKEIQDLRKRIFDIQNNMDLSNLKDESLPNIYEYDDGTFSLNVFHKNQDKFILYI